MGLFDQLAGQVLGSLTGGAGQQGGGAQAALLQVVMNLLQNSEGGLGGLLGRLGKAGLGEQAASWVGTGQNQAVNADQIGQVFGASELGDMAAQLGLPTDQIAGHLANLLPQVIDGLTPNGQIPEAGNIDLGQALSGLAAMLGMG